MIELFISSTIIGAISAVIGYCWTEILTEPGEIFGWVKKILHRLLMEGGRKLEFIYKPIIGCQLCNSGQWALCISIGYSWWMSVFTGTDLVESVLEVIIIIYGVSLAIVLAKAWVKLLRD